MNVDDRDIVSWWDMFAKHSGIDVMVLDEAQSKSFDRVTLLVGDFVANCWDETFTTENVGGVTFSGLSMLLGRLAVVLHCVDNNVTPVGDVSEFVASFRSFLQGVTED